MYICATRFPHVLNQIGIYQSLRVSHFCCVVFSQLTLCVESVQARRDKRWQQHLDLS